MPPVQLTRPTFCGRSVVLLSGILLAGCAVDPSRPGDAAMSCDQIAAEIAKQDEVAQISERRASELRPGYYAFQAAEMVPFVGTGFGLADQIGDASHSRELDYLNEDARDARHRRDYLKQIQPAHCPLPAATAGPGERGHVPAS